MHLLAYDREVQMRYSNLESERTSDKLYDSIKDGEIGSEDYDDITQKIPLEKFCQINNAPLVFDDPAAFVRIILLIAKPHYHCYYGTNVYAVFIRTENSHAWFGMPVKNSKLGIMKWHKSHFDKIYGFTMSMSIQEDA